MIPMPDPDGEDFYEAMQAYRHCPITHPEQTIIQFENVKRLVRAYGDAVREQAAMIVQENADACSGHVREILLANAAAIRSA